MFGRRLMLVTTLVCSFFCAISAQQNTDITADGSGIGANNAEALINAKRDAIEKGIGQILLSRTEIENFMVKRDQIVTKTIGAVRSYQVISEGATPDGLYQMKIRATLSARAMREDLAAFHILIESMNKPRVMVVIAENNIGNEDPANSASETAIIKFLRTPYEFDIVDQKVIATLRASQQKMASLAGNAAEAASIGSQYGAEVIITGTAVSREANGMSGSLGGMVSVQADVSLKAINCSNGRVIGTASAHGARVHISPNTAGSNAIAQASERASKELLDVIITEWQNQQNNGATLSISIKGVSSFRLKNSVLSTLSGLGTVATVRERSWDAQSGLLELDVQYKGNVEGFCTKLDGLKLKTGGGSLSVIGVNGASVTLQTQAI
jgi:hypothetical protein